MNYTFDMLKEHIDVISDCINAVAASNMDDENKSIVIHKLKYSGYMDVKRSIQ